MLKSTVVVAAAILTSMTAGSLIGDGLGSALVRNGMFNRDPTATRLDERPFVLIMVGMMYCIMSLRLLCYYDRLIDPRRRRFNNLKVVEFLVFLLFAWHCYYTFQMLHKWNWNSEASLRVKASAKILVSAGNKFIRYFSSGFPILFNFICTIIGFIKGPINTILDKVMWILPLRSDVGDSTEERMVYWCIIIFLFLSIYRYFRNNGFFLF